ncbi:MAG: 4-amino-4-deoxychorismate lyase [Gammaproteobacteria bacterium]|jgi:4-amino-4-deoxychorismate lyase
MPSGALRLGALVNGVWQDQPRIAISDSGLAYGLALFETMRVADGEVPLLAGHISRLSKALASLCIPEGSIDLAMSDLASLVASQSLTDAVVRLTLTAGEAGRGYALAEGRQATRIVQAFAVPESNPLDLRLGIADTRLSPNPNLSGLKHSNRIEQVLARQELSARQGLDDLLLLDAEDNVIEAIASNLFVVQGDRLCTPGLSSCGVQGVMKARAMERFSVIEKQLSIDSLKSADELLLSNALGIKRVKELRVGGEIIHYKTSNMGNKLVGIVPW